MMRVAAIGSSGTYGFQIARDQTWPAQLERLCRARGQTLEVANFASPGLPIEAYAERLIYLRGTFDPGLVIVQLPPTSRAFIGINGSQQLREKDRPPWEIFGWAGPGDATHRPAPTRIHLERLLAVPGSPFFHLLEPFFYSRVAENNGAVSWQQFQDFARFWADNVANSDLQHVAHAKEITFLQMVLERWDLPYLMFDWHNYNSRHDRRHGLFGPTIDYSRYVNDGVQTAIGFLTEHGHDGLFLDAHGHLTPDGHRDLAEHFLLPALSRILPGTLTREAP